LISRNNIWWSVQLMGLNIMNPKCSNISGMQKFWQIVGKLRPNPQQFHSRMVLTVLENESIGNLWKETFLRNWYSQIRTPPPPVLSTWKINRYILLLW
jgi:hypothetical protein